LLGATHSVALLVRTHASSGFTYWCALSMTLALALCAFVLSFDALSALAITAGIDREIAWLWPLVIDVSIAQATMALLSLTLRRRTADISRRLKRSGRTQRERAGAAPVEAPTDERGRVRVDGDASAVQCTTLLTVGDQPSTTALELHDTVAESRWNNVADLLVRQKRTKIEPAVVAMVLAMTEARTPPSTIGRRLKVHHTAVRRIQEAAAELTG
jgi:membrane protein implicated in regulation of membrane protease activity